MTADVSTDKINFEALSRAANEARGLAMDAVAACKSGHLGLPLGAAEMGAALFGQLLSYNPKDPKWLNRDRFVLSAGHGSMFLYAWLHLAGYDLSLEDIKSFRELHSKTPGHPESTETPGVESTTGPLGQGVGNAVGMACAARFLAAKTSDAIINHSVVCLCGDGDLQEGVAMESVAFAACQGLDNLILIYDSNDVTLDAPAEKTQTEDTAAKFTALGFDVETVDGHDIGQFINVFSTLKSQKNGKPKIIIAKTIIGKGIPEVEATFKAHGEAGVPHVEESRRALGLPGERFFVSQETQAYFKNHEKRLTDAYDTWQTHFAAWEKENPEQAQVLKNAQNHAPIQLNIPAFPEDKGLATRAASGEVLNHVAPSVPFLISGSADLHGSTKNYIKDGSGDMDPTNPAGRNIYFGIREHAMGAIVNGFAYYGLFRPSGATFLTFSDYMRPSIRLAALAKLPTFYIFTHDSVGVGMDGPTHQPVEHTPSLRLIPNLDVIRPADAEETAGAYMAVVERTDGPTALILTRQGLPILKDIPVETRRQGVLKGAYVAMEEEGPLERIIIATGSELHLALEAAKQIKGTRVVSMPCVERFTRQDKQYQESVLPGSVPHNKRIAIEATSPQAWYQFAGQVIGVQDFGLSASGDEVFAERGITAEAIINLVKSLN